MIIDLVDSFSYATTNCFAYQITTYMNDVPNLKTIELSNIENVKNDNIEGIVCRCKQRSIVKYIEKISALADSTPVIIYDQDPWEAFIDESPYNGAYNDIFNALNVKTFAVPSKWWSDYILQRGLPSTFVRMWILPANCSERPNFIDRKTNVGFIGSVHKHRAKLFDQLLKLGIDVYVVGTNSYSYPEYVKLLSNVKIYIRTEDSQKNVNGNVVNLQHGLWGRDIEVASRGCFSIRDRGLYSETYIDGIETIFLYDDVKDIPMMIKQINDMDVVERQMMIDRSVERIRSLDYWRETVKILTDFT